MINFNKICIFSFLISVSALSITKGWYLLGHKIEEGLDTLLKTENIYQYKKQN